jgi:hypothetical protein
MSDESNVCRINVIRLNNNNKAQAVPGEKQCIALMRESMQFEFRERPNGRGLKGFKSS